MKDTWIQLALALLVCAVLTIPLIQAIAQEHPEHPTEKEHPEHPEEKTEASLTIEQLAQAINDYVRDDARAKGGFFLVYDPVAKKSLVLTLDRVHEERLSGLGGGVYFACADFTSPEGTVYDIDVFMKEAEAGLEATEVHVHKVDGKPRYTWKEQGGVWVRERTK
jgi:hypothetical protein